MIKLCHGIFRSFLIIIGSILCVENVVLQILMETTIPWIKWENLDYQKDLEERKRWFKIIPKNNIPGTATTVACQQHWSESFETLIYYGKEIPNVSPSLFDYVKRSMIPTKTPSKWISTKAHSDATNILPDKMGLFLQ